MIERWLRRALRRCGLDLPFSHVVCPEDVKSIAIEGQSGAVVTVRRTLVFLQTPEAGDLHDTIFEAGVDGAYYASADGVELSRTRKGRAVVVSWRPRLAVTPYALYSHEYTWRASGDYTHPAVFTEISCDIRTGAIGLEMLTPSTFETAVVFKRPRWPRLTTERSVVKYALRQLDAAGERPVIADYGRRLQWRLVGPKLGDRYMCVAFHQYGVAMAEQRLKDTSFVGRLRHLLSPLIPA